MTKNSLIRYCPKCGGRELNIEMELGQYNVTCGQCNFYCEIVVFDEGDKDEVIEHS